MNFEICFETKIFFNCQNFAKSDFVSKEETLIMQKNNHYILHAWLQNKKGKKCLHQQEDFLYLQGHQNRWARVP